MEIESIVRVMQASVGPCVLISAEGLLLLTMSNRIGRPIDRARALLHELGARPETERRRLESQIRILYRRAHVLRGAIGLGILSMVLVSLVILLVFATLSGQVSAERFVMPLFAASLVALVGSLGLLLMDIGMTLGSLHIEMREQLGTGWVPRSGHSRASRAVR